jgi:hypothetical protein
MLYLERIVCPIASWMPHAKRVELDSAFNRPGMAECMTLKVLHLERQPRLERIQRARECRISFLTALREWAEDGKIAVMESGRDCDCVEYSGSAHLIDATVAAYDELYERTAKWADGPFYFTLERPSVARGVEYESRDLVLEAFEDGHPHVVYSQYP